MDQIGSCYRRLLLPYDSNQNTILTAIEHFGDPIVTTGDLSVKHAIIALRNAFAHDFNLINIPTRRRTHPLYQLERHKFTVVSDVTDTVIVKLPSVPWTEEVRSKSFDDRSSATTINLYMVGELAEGMLRKVKALLLTDELGLNISPEELLHKYTFIQW